MVKKLKQMADKQASGAAGMFDRKLASAVKDSAHQIWLAGMGAFSKAQAEGGKVFEALIKEGTSLQKKTQHVAEEKFSEVSSKMTGMAGEVQAKAGQQWDKLESISRRAPPRRSASSACPRPRMWIPCASASTSSTHRSPRWARPRRRRRPPPARVRARRPRAQPRLRPSVPPARPASVPRPARRPDRHAMRRRRGTSA
jgi:hypothetical protein